MKRVAFDRDLLAALAAHEPGHPLLSIYLPTTSEPAEQTKNEIRLKNAHRQAANELERAGVNEERAAAWVEPLLRANGELWSGGGRGTGIFIDGTDAKYVRLPNPVDELVVAAYRYHLKPLYAALPFDATYFLLALSQNEVALFSGDGTTLRRVELDADVPGSLTDVAGHELTGRSLQHHGGNRGSSAAVFHGQGAGKDDSDAEVERFLRETSKALRERYLDGSALVLAGVSELLGQFRRISDYGGIVAEEVTGNVEHLNVERLHEKAWPIIEQRFRRRCAAELKQLVDGETGQPVSRDLTKTVVAADDGRVARLFVASDRRRWGVFDRDRRRVVTHAERQPADSDLLDVAASRAFLSGAEVWPVPAAELPGDGDSIALLRY